MNSKLYVPYNLKQKVLQINNELFPQILKIALTEEMEDISGVSEFKLNSIISGYPAFLVFLSNYGSFFLTHDDLEVCYSHLILKIKNQIENKGIQEISLFDGLTGVCQSIALVNLKNNKYQKLLNDLELYLIDRLKEDYLLQIQKDIDSKQPTHPDYYDVVVGLSGIAAYFLNFSISLKGRDFLEKILQILVKRCKPIHIQFKEVPGWYCFSHYELLEEEKNEFPNGSFNLGLAHGVTGILAILSLSVIKGCEVEGQLEVIRYISDWLYKFCSQSSCGIRWADKVSFEEVTENRPLKNKFYRDAWCYGSAGVARTLFLAGKALSSTSSKERAAAAFLDIFKRSSQDWNLDPLTFCHGLSGLLRITSLMEQDTKNDSFRKNKEKLLELILDQYEPSKIFGFFENGGIIRNSSYPNKIEYLCGILGVISSLNACVFEHDINWDLTFLIE